MHVKKTEQQISRDSMNTALKVVSGISTVPVKTASPTCTRPTLQPPAKTRLSAPRQPHLRSSGPLKPESASLSDAIRLAQLGDAAAFETIYKLHSRRVYALCLRMIGDPVEAEDLTQEAFLQLFRKIHTFRGESAFSSWLHRLTANIVLMRFRKKRLVPSSLDEMATPDGEKDRPALEIGAPDLRLVGVFDRLNLHAAIEQLPEGYKSMFLLHDVHGYEHHEIARMLGCSIGNSKSQLFKARKRLRELLHKVQYCGSYQMRAPAGAAVSP
jgi:RNA polymerase sigma-70 factor, ECF subfamily